MRISDEPPPKRPADWNLTIEDLFAEMKAGKRTSVGHPEIEWAKEYERGLLPSDIRFPQKGDVYESKRDQTVHYMTAWSAPFTGGGEATLFKGECVWVEKDPMEDQPLGTYALPVDYETLEKRMVPKEELEDPRFGGFYFHFKTVDLNTNFILVETGYSGKGEHQVRQVSSESAPSEEP